MDFSRIDKPFDLFIKLPEEDIEWRNADESPFKVYGAYSTTPYLRLPEEIGENTNSGVAELYKNTSGIRLRFRTNSPYLAIHVIWSKQSRSTTMSVSGASCFDLYTYNDLTKQQSFINSLCCPFDSPDGFDGLCHLKGEMRDYVLNFPLYNNVDKLYIGVKENSVIEEPSKYANELPVVFYGSSITQGACASRAGNNYENILSRWLNIDYINLGFSGHAFAEDIIVDYMSSLKMSAFVCDYDHNAPTVEHLEKTHYKMYCKFREKNPNVPYIMLTKPDYFFEEEKDIRRSIIMETYIKALRSGDKNVYFIDGASIFSDIDYDNCTMETCHPNDVGFLRFAKALFPTLKNALFGKTF